MTSRRATAPHRYVHAVRRHPAIPRSRRDDLLEVAGGVLVIVGVIATVVALVLLWPA